MADGEKCYLLNFRPIIDRLNEKLDSSSFNRFSFRNPFSLEEYAVHLFNWVSEQILDQDAVSNSDIAAAYLKSLGMDEEQAKRISHETINDIVALITEHFPRMTYDGLSKARYLLRRDDSETLEVFITQ
jgi:hypothetical protein